MNTLEFFLFAWRERERERDRQTDRQTDRDKRDRGGGGRDWADPAGENGRRLKDAPAIAIA